MAAHNKFNVCPPEQRTFEGVVFHSQKEMVDHQGFRILEKAGAIAKLQRQIAYPLLAWSPTGPVPIGKYICDHVVTELDGTIRLYDSKGFQTKDSKRTMKIFAANYPHLRVTLI